MGSGAVRIRAGAWGAKGRPIGRPASSAQPRALDVVVRVVRQLARCEEQLAALAEVICAEVALEQPQAPVAHLLRVRARAKFRVRVR